ncbi:MAG: hypothetical protein OXT68_14660 [Chloroflexota bacterium]|nr:hypothetical protein [Chloroflexota bacterium]MDE2951991.1 hypothetical protein [Chloroflexota bacterium]
MRPLEKEYRYFLEIMDDLAQKHGAGKYVAIKGHDILGVYSSYEDAAKAVYQDHEKGTVLLQRIEESIEAMTVYLHTPRILASS